MRRFRDYPISRKLMLTFGVAAVVALSISIALLAVTSWFKERERALNELHTIANIIGANSNAALVFQDHDAAGETLATLKALKDIEFAALYDGDGNEFARYVSNGNIKIMSGIIPKHDRIEGNYITVVEPVVLDNAAIGTVVLQATMQTRWGKVKYDIAITAGLLTLASVIAMLFTIVLGRSITVPLTALSDLMKNVSQDHNYSVRTNIQQDDEVGVLASGIDDMLSRAGERDIVLEKHRLELEQEVSRRTEALRTANEKLVEELSVREKAEKELQQAHQALEHHHHEFSLLSEMNDRLQVCHSVEETSPVVAHYARRLFKGSSGGLYVFNASRSLVEPVVLWGSPQPRNDVFKQNDCWALRQGRPHFVENPKDDLICPHCELEIDVQYFCIPMIAYGDVMGVLHLRLHEEALELAHGKSAESIRQLAITASEHLALALANLKLREVLQAQSVRDPLTGLFNRRYMEESLDRELARCQRNNTRLGVVMIDIDFFKRFNDTYGHEAGDIVLQELGEYLIRIVRNEDIACRYGGEEFILIMPGINIDDFRVRVEEIRTAVKSIKFYYKGRQLEGLSVSIGGAIYPQHGDTVDDLIEAADKALYQAKKRGRDKVVLADD